MPTPTVFQIFAVNEGDSPEQTLIYSSDAMANSAPFDITVVSPKLKKETNKADSLEFMVLPGNPAYNKLEKMKTYIQVTRDNEYIFYGRVSEVKIDIYKQKSVTCEGFLAFLADSVQAPNKKTDTESAGSTKKKKRQTVYYTVQGTSSTDKNVIKMSVNNYFRSLIDAHNSQINDNRKRIVVGTVSINDADTVETFERTSYQDTSSIVTSELLSVHGGVLQTRYENGVAYLDWLEEFTNTISQTIQFGVNLIDLDQEPPTDEVWSILLPVGEDNVTIESVNSGSKYLTNSTAVNKYGRIVHYHKFNNVKKASELKRRAQRYLASHSKVFPDNLNIKAIDLQLLYDSNDPEALGNTIDSLELGEKIQVISSPHGINQTMACIEMELDLQNPENNSYTLGTIMPPDKEKKKSRMSEKYRSTKGSTSRGINQNSTGIDQLNNDVNTVANNVNVNSENIAVNAQNIAVNAENIAVVAANVSVTAQTIDIKAQQITTSITDAEGNIRAQISLTEQGLIAEFNETIYGEDGTGDTDGIVHDYKSRISASATALTSAYEDAISDSEDNITAAYRSEIQQTADSISTEVSKKVGKTEIISRINQTAESILIQAQRIDLSGYTTMTDFSALSGKVTNLTTGTENATKIRSTRFDALGSLYIGDSSNDANLYYRGSEYKACLLKVGSAVNPGRYIFATVPSGASNNNFDLDHSHSVTVNNDGTITLGAASSTGGSFRIADTKAYKDGVSAAIASVTITSVNKDPNASISYDSSNNKYTIPLKAVASNNATKTANYSFFATDAYNAVTITSVDKNPNSNISYNSSNNIYTIPLKAVASNSKTKTAVYSFYGTDAFNAGESSVSVSSIARRSGYSDTYSSSYSFEGDVEASYIVHLIATASNGATKTQNITVDASSAYSDGYDAGYDAGSSAGGGGGTLDPDMPASEVVVNEIRNYAFGYTNGNIGVGTASIRVTLTNGNVSTHTVSINATAAYNDGYNTGQADMQSMMHARYVDVTHVTVHSNGRATVTVQYNGTTYNHLVDASNVQDNHS